MVDVNGRSPELFFLVQKDMDRSYRRRMKSRKNANPTENTISAKRTADSLLQSKLWKSGGKKKPRLKEVLSRVKNKREGQEETIRHAPCIKSKRIRMLENQRKRQGNEGELDPNFHSLKKTKKRTFARPTIKSGPKTGEQICFLYQKRLDARLSLK